ncbi:prepilin-type N-terminal cleavage/methylation domain-containing protein [Limnobacter sp.]|uniref:prepilin-type N-terminal cleavage/methylation domain-containing protein n=1 Tax=Limnobacter sp. TaxID=2003368 RepID=UPI002FDFA0D8
MRAGLGFTLIEIAIAIAIVGILATLSFAGYESSWEKSNFRSMREFGVELALSQQLHRQRYGRYAQSISSSGNPDANRLVMPSASKYQVNISSADFRGYRAQVKTHSNDPMRLPTDCRILVVESDMGIQRFGSKSATNQNTSDRCVPHG